MANYKVGDLDVTISGVSKDAISSLDEVIKQLDTLQGKLGIVGKGFSGAFKNINSGAIRTVSADFEDIARTTETAANSQQKLTATIEQGQASAKEYSTALVVVSEAQENVESSFKRLTALLNAQTYSRLSSDVGNLATQWKNLYTTMQRSSLADALTGGQFSAEAQNRLTRLTQEYLNKKRAIDETNEAFKRMAMTEQELFVYDTRLEETTRKKRMEYLQLALATSQAGVNAQAYAQELQELSQKQSAFESSIHNIQQILLSPFERATAQASELKKRLTETFYNTGAFDSSLLGQFQTLTKGIEATNEALRRVLMTEQEKVLADYQQENASRRQRISYLNLMLATGQAGEKTREYKQELKQLVKQQQIADKVAGKSAQGGLSKFINRIGRIALYRTIRRGLQLITQTFTESIQAYAQVDDNINDMMSKLTSSTKVISLSLGTMIFPLLQAITPVVQQLSVGFANMANAINKSMALAQGNATYTKINTDALQDYRKELNKTSGALFDFDKFRALSSKQDTASTFLSTEDVSALDEAESKYSGTYTLVSGIGDVLAQALRLVGQIVDTASPILDIVFKIAGWLLKGVGYVLDFLNNTGLIEPILYGILTVLGLIGAAKVIAWISSGAAKTAILGLANALKTNLISGLKSLEKNINTTTGAFVSWGIAIAAITAAVKILSNWDDFNKGTKIAITVVSGLATALLAAATAAMALHGTLTLGTAIPLITAAVASGAIFIRGLVDIPNYAVGASDIDSGTIFRAGEAGKTEAVFTGSNGKTNVANVQQMYQAEYMAVLQALKDYGAARGEMPQLQPASDTGIYQAASRGARKVGKTFGNV